MKIGSLFAGVGGLELGLEWSGVGNTVWQVEIDSFCQAVLRKNWPSSKLYGDIRSVNPSDMERVDVICGGFPCQDISFAGNRLGLDGTRSGLWYEYLRIVSYLRPKYVVIENVSSITKGTSAAATRVLDNLSKLGYNAIWCCIKASDVGSPQNRDRWFCVAKMGNTYGMRKPQQERCLSYKRRRTSYSSKGISERGSENETESRLGRKPHGIPEGLDFPLGRGLNQKDSEPPREIPFEKDKTVSNRIKALGNSVSPHVAYVVGKIVLTWNNKEI